MGNRRGSGLLYAWRTAFLLALVAVSGIFASAEAPASPVRAAGEAEALMGDVNCTGAVDIADAAALRRSAAGLLPNPSCIALAADVTCDHNVDAADVLAVLRSLAGLPVSSPQGCVGVGAGVGAGPTSSELIAAALAANEIDAPTALVYGVFAAYGDPRLPGEFQGDDSTEPTSLGVAKAFEGWSTLSPAQQEMLLPYMLPPSAAGSWYEDTDGPGFAPQGFSNLISTLVPVVGTPGIRLWTDASFPALPLADLSAALTQVLETTKSSMDRTPLDDSSAPNHGPDGALDVYVLPGLVAKAQAKWYEPNVCKNGPMFVEIDALSLPSSLQPNSGGFAGALQSLAHVLTQATAGGVDTPGSQSCVFGDAFRWAVEATGALTEHLAYPDVNSEHRWDEIFETPHVSVHELDEGGHTLWMLLEHLAEDSPNVVSQLWTQAETQPSALAALAASVDLDDQFPEFALELLNEGPNNHFNLIHGITQRVFGNTGMAGGGGLGALAIDLGGLSSVALSTSLTALDDFSAQHYRFTITDPEVKSVSISNLVHNLAGTTIQAMGKDGAGLWKALELATGPLTSICLADAGKHLTDITIVLTHSDTENQAPAQFANEPLIEARNSCGFTGSVGYTRHQVCDPFAQGTECPGDVGGTEFLYQMTATNLVFTASETPVPDQEYFLLASGTLNVTISGHLSTCTVYGDDTIVLPAGQGAIRIRHNQDGSTDYALYGYFDGPQSEFTVRYDCGSGEQTFNVPLGQWLCSGGARSTPSENMLDGAYHWESPEVDALISCPGTTASLPPNSSAGPSAINNGQTRDYSWTFTR